MKLLRNPIVVGVLALLAVGLLVRNVVWPMLGNARPHKAPPAAARATPAPKPAQPPAAAVASTAPAKTVSSQLKALAANQLQGLQAKLVSAPAPDAQEMELGLIRAGAGKWVQAPRRDPFRSAHSGEGRAAQLLKLKAIWRQAGSGSLTTINNRVLSEGDKIEEFTIEKIEPDHVWVMSPGGGREALAFKLPTPIQVEAPELVSGPK